MGKMYLFAFNPKLVKASFCPVSFVTNKFLFCIDQQYISQRLAVTQCFVVA